MDYPKGVGVALTMLRLGNFLRCLLVWFVYDRDTFSLHLLSLRRLPSS